MHTHAAELVKTRKRRRSACRPGGSVTIAGVVCARYLDAGAVEQPEVIDADDEAGRVLPDLSIPPINGEEVEIDMEA
jgi:hypothetical protein